MRISDVSQVFTKHVNGPMRVNEHGYLGHLEHILSKACFFVWRFYIPYAVWNVDMSDLVMYSIVIELMTGYWLAYNFQVSHISTVADFPLNDKGSPVGVCLFYVPRSYFFMLTCRWQDH